MSNTLPIWLLASLLLCACTPQSAINPKPDLTRFIRPGTLPVSAEALPVNGNDPGEAPPANADLPPDETGTADTATEVLELNLDKTVATVLDAAPEIRSGLERVHLSMADLMTASLPPNPTVSVSSTLMPLGRSFIPTRQGGPPQFDAGINFPIDWFLFGKRAAAMTLAREGVDVAHADFVDLIRKRVALAVATFYDVLEARDIVELARQDLNDLLELERITASRVEIGGVGTIELDRIRLSIFSSRRELRAREMAHNAALSRLRAVLGTTDSRPITLQGSLDVVTPLKPIPLTQALTLALDNRPDLTSLRLQVQQAQALIASEEHKRYPQIAPGIGYTRQFQEKTIGYPDASSFGVGVNLSLPLFDRNQGNIARAQSLKAQAEWGLKSGEIALRSEIEQAVHAYQTAYQTLSSDDPGQLDAARHVRDKIRAAYELGGKSLIEVMDAQRAYRETYRLHIAGRSDYWHSLHALNAALGKQALQ